MDTSVTGRVACTIKASGIWKRGPVAVLGDSVRGAGESWDMAELVAGKGVWIDTGCSAEQPASSANTRPTGQRRAMAPSVGAESSLTVCSAKAASPEWHRETER